MSQEIITEATNAENLDKRFKLYQQTIESAAFNLARCNEALSCIHDQYKELNDYSDDGVAYIIDLINCDMESIQDHLNRALEGRCQIRGARPSSLRPSEDWEAMHRDIYGGVA